MSLSDSPTRRRAIVESDDGTQAWLWNDQLLPNVGFNAVVGRPVREHSMEPTRFDEMRRGSWDVTARLDDMDINGVWASVCFPSFLPGFVGQRLTLWPHDEDLAFAMMRAYNDWHLDAWCAADPDRFIPNQIPWLRDPARAADEIRRNAARGFKAVTFTEAPHLMGLPSLHTGHWDPFFAACEETETVVCLHVGSSGTTPTTAPDAPPVTVGVLFFGYAMFAAVDWLYSKVPVRFPRLKICLSEGGIGWVAGLIDRIDHIHRHGDEILDDTWRGIEPSPSDVLRRNFWFCAIDDESSYANRHVIGVDNILVESDYPHSDSTWPDTQSSAATTPRRGADRRTTQDLLAERRLALPPPAHRPTPSHDERAASTPSPAICSRACRAATTSLPSCCRSDRTGGGAARWSITRSPTRPLRRARCRDRHCRCRDRNSSAAHRPHVIGIDLSEQMLRYGAAKIDHERPARPHRSGHRHCGSVAVSRRRLRCPDVSPTCCVTSTMSTATLAELARVVQPDGVIASLEFFVPPNRFWRMWWWLYTRIVLPLAGGLAGRSWWRVGRFLGPSISNHYRDQPLASTIEAWRAAGVDDVGVRQMSLGGGIVMWGRKRAG